MPKKYEQYQAAYGSLYMDEGEDILLAYTQIDNLQKEKPSLWFFDVICTKKQIDLAKANLVMIKQRIMEKNPDVLEEHCFFGYTLHNEQRPALARLKMLLHMTGETVDVATIDAAHKRKSKWSKLWQRLKI